MGKTVLISGASSGFGSLTAHALADAGYTVYAGYAQHRHRQRPGGRGGEEVLRRTRRRPAHRRARRHRRAVGADRGQAGAVRGRPDRRAGTQRRTHRDRSGRGVHPRAARRPVRHQRDQPRWVCRLPRPERYEPAAPAGGGGAGTGQRGQSTTSIIVD